MSGYFVTTFTPDPTDVLSPPKQLEEFLNGEIGDHWSLSTVTPIGDAWAMRFMLTFEARDE